MSTALATGRGPGDDPLGKRAQAAILARRLGLLAILERVPQRRCLVVVNYHRIGNPQDIAFDRGVVEATSEEFALQMSWLKRHFHVATLEEAQRLVDRPSDIRHPVFLVTFDDGYRDSYDVAFPVLKALSLPATFFLVTSLVASRIMPWWDQIADLVRRVDGRPIDLEYPWPIRITGEPEQATRQILGLYKDPATSDSDRFLTDLVRACASPLRNETDGRLFLDWEEAREMLAAGMSFGSHTHNHELLARQSESAQRSEVIRSREIIRANLGIRCDALAFPVGSPTSFSAVTQKVLEDAGYRTAFSYYGGVNKPGRIDRFNVLRIPTCPELGIDGYRLRGLISATLARAWP